VQKVFESYRTLWAGIFEQLGGAVFWAAEEYGNKVINEKRLDISTDDLVKVDLRELSAAISLFTDRRLIPHKTAMLKVLQTLGIENAQEIVMEFGDKMEDEYKSIYHTQPSSSAPVIRDTDGEGGGKQVGGVGQQGDEDKETKLGIRPGSEKRITRRTM
jgi:predicted secreted acid phosphatase